MFVQAVFQFLIIAKHPYHRTLVVLALNPKFFIRNVQSRVAANTRP